MKKGSIRERARELGFDDCRFTTATTPDHADRFQRWLENGHHGEMGWLQRNAHKRIDPQHVLANARTIITVAASYARAKELMPEGARSHSEPMDRPVGEVARYARFLDYHDVLKEPLVRLTHHVDSLNPSGGRSLWYVDTGPFLERDLAARAGIGFVGKHTNLISRKLGNWFFLAEIITPLEIEPDASEKNRCGSCTRCLAACPTGAITEPFHLDARKCISYLTIELKGSIPEDLRSAIGNRIYGCDDCLAVCPWNKFAQTGRLMKEHARPEMDEPDLIRLLALDADGFKRHFAGTPMMRTKRRGILRNVCVALGNVGGRNALPALHAAAADAEPLIREHALWAVQQIERRTADATTA